METRDHILEVVAESYRQYTDCDNGRPGMSFWQICVFAILKQGFNVDDDWLVDLASNHMGTRSLAGLSNVLDLRPISAATLANSISCLTDDD